MSANIMWEPKKDRGRNLGVMAPSNFIEGMKRVFGWPCTVGPGDLEKLDAMAAVGGNQGYEELSRVIRNVDGPVKVWAEH